MKKETVTCRICGAKNSFPILKRRLKDEEDIYTKFCPNPQLLEERELDGILQRCSNCGYIFPRIDEDTKLKRRLLNTKTYQFPFTENYRGSAAALECYQLALLYREMECYALSAQWHIYAAVLLDETYEKERQKCYRKAYLRLRKCKSSYEIELAKLNLLRLHGMHERAVDVGKELARQYEGIEKNLIEVIVWLAKHRNSNYMTYFEMLSIDIKGE